MKRLIITTIVLLVLTLQNVLPQLMSIKKGPKYAFDLDLSPKIAVGNASFSNANITSDPNASKDDLGLDYSYGGKLGLTFISGTPRYIFFSIYTDYLINSFNQMYNLKDFTIPTIPTDYQRSIDFKSQQLNFMLRMTGFTGSKHDQGKYLEIGIRQSTLKSVNEDFIGTTYTNTSSPISKYNPKYKSFVAGFGFYGNYVNFGVRTSFALNDIMIANNNPISGGLYENTNSGYNTNFADYQATKLFTVELVLEINLYFLEVGTASCGHLALSPFPMFLNQDYIW